MKKILVLSLLCLGMSIRGAEMQESTQQAAMVQLGRINVTLPSKDQLLTAFVKSMIPASANTLPETIGGKTMTLISLAQHVCAATDDRSYLDTLFATCLPSPSREHLRLLQQAEIIPTEE